MHDMTHPTHTDLASTGPGPGGTDVPPSWRRTSARWMVTFAGFPLGGLAAAVLVGPVESRPTALLGGLLTGTVLGAVQSWGLGRHGPPSRHWIPATAMGLALGLTAGATLVDFGTSMSDLVVQGVCTGLGVGLAQAVVLRRRLGALALVWPLALAAIWAVGWAVTTSIGVQVDEQFTVFGSSGALTVTALSVVLPLVLRRRTSGAS